jgi:excisionase family DNA binding protein
MKRKHRSQKKMEDRTTTALNEELPLLLNAREVATLLRVAPNTIYELARLRAIPGSRRIGRALRFSRDAILRWVRDETSK